MAIKDTVLEKKVEVEREVIINYTCDICGKDVPREKVVYYETLDVDAAHTGNMEMCQECFKVFEDEEQKLIDRLKAERGSQP